MGQFERSEAKDQTESRIARWMLGVSLIYAIAVRVVYLLWDSHNSPFFYSPISDALMYHNWALEIMRGKLLLDHPFYQGPLYPYLLGAVYYLFGAGPWPIRIVQAAMGIGNILLIYRIARYQVPAVWAATAAAMAALYFGFAFHESFLLLETLDLHLLLWGLFLSLRATHSGRPLDWALAGLAIGLACLARPNALLLLPLIGLWLLVRGGRQLKPSVLGVCALVLGAGIAILPATAHNWVAGHRLVLITENGGSTFMFGNNPSAQGVMGLPPGFTGNILTQRQEELEIAQHLLGKPLTPEEADHYWFRRSLQFLLAHPGFALHLEYLKFRRLISDDEFAGNYSMKYDPNPYKAMMPLSFGVILGFAVWGMAKADWKSPAMQLFAIFLFVPAVTVMIFFMTARYRLPAVPVLILLAAVGAQAAMQSAFEHRRWKLLMAVYVIALTVYVSYLPLPKIGDQASEWVREGVAWIHLNRPDRALQCFALAREHNPKERGLWLNTALALYREDKLPQALEAADRAEQVEIDADKPLALSLKGAILLSQKQFGEAEVDLRQAEAQLPSNGQISLALASLYFQTKRYPEARAELQKAEAAGVDVPARLETALGGS